MEKSTPPSALSATSRVAFIDWLRVVACFLVMLVHASENFYGADSSGLAGNLSMLANESNRFWVAFYDGGVARTCVPLFIIASAYLLAPMHSGQTMIGFYRRRFSRILPPMLVFMLLYTFLPLAWGAMTWEQSVNDLKMLPFNFPSMAGHLWFMYPLISIYLIIPVVSPWLERASASDERLFLGLFVFSTLLPWLHRFVSAELWGECFWNGFSMLWYCSGYLGYLVLAHYIRVHLQWSIRRKMLTGLTCFLLGSAFTAWSFWFKGIPGQLIETPMLEWSWEFCTPNVLCATFGAFLMFSCIEGQNTPRIITTMARWSFAMYLMHLFFLGPIAGVVIGGDAATPLVPVALAIPLIAIATFICCVTTSGLLSLVPGCRWFAGIDK